MVDPIMCRKFVSNIKTNNMKEFYLQAYPTDELGAEINEGTNFYGLLDCLWSGKDVYEYIGVYDSLVRERLFDELQNRANFSREHVSYIWLKNN